MMVLEESCQRYISVNLLLFYDFKRKDEDTAPTEPRQSVF